MNKKTLIAGAVILLLLIGGGAFLLSNPGADSKRANILKLAQDYASQGEEQRALDLLDQLLIANGNDTQAQALRESVVKQKRDKEAGDKQAQLDALKSANDKLKQGLQDLSNKLSSNDSQSQQASKVKAAADAAASAALAADDAARKKAQRDKEEADRLAKQNADKEKLSADEKAKRDLFDQGMGLLNASKFPEAKQKFTEVLDKDPGFVDAIVRKAESVFKTNKASPDSRKEALDLLSQGLTKDPKNSRAYALQGDIYEETKNWPEAVNSYRGALKTDPGNAGYWYELGKIYFLNHQYSQAVDAFQSCVKLDATNPQAFYLMGASYFSMKNDKSALDAFTAAVKLKPQTAAYHYWAAQALANQGRDALALGYFESAVKLDGANATYQKELGVAYYKAGRFPEAEATLLRALAADNKNAGAAFNLSQTELALGKTTQALDYIQKAVSLDPTEPDYTYNLGVTLEKAGNPDLAATAYKNTLKLDSKNLAMINLGKILKQKGDLDGAMSLLKTAYDLYPANLEVNNNLGDLYMAKELYTQAIDFFRKALDKKTDTPLIRYNLALAYLQTNQKDLAKSVLQDLIKLDGKYWDAYYTLGGVLYDLGDADGGKKVYQELLAKNPAYPKKAEVQAILSK